ncbi:MAG: MutS protein msh4 [Trizodia sp. TS-e1964]|nr:MAG: MutS protein msh4 [Trizodia sp. TS-e1964]
MAPSMSADTSSIRPSTTLSMSYESRTNIGRPGTSIQPHTNASSLGGQQIICALTESRGIMSTVGIAFVNISTAEASLTQISESKLYTLTMHKLALFNPSEILIMSTAANPKSAMYTIIEENCNGTSIVPLDRKIWSEQRGLEYITQLAFTEDVEAIKLSASGNYFSICSLAAQLINNNINEDTQYSNQPLALRNQRTYAVKAGVDGRLDAARDTYKATSEEIGELAEEIKGRL